MSTEPSPSSSAPQTAETTQTANSTDPLDPSSFKYYNPSNISSPAPIVPDNFYTPTASDLQGAQATLAARTQNLVDAPLQLRAAREANERAKRDRWPTTTIRIRFSDRSQLEKSFPSSDKIRSVYAFVRDCLREDVQPIKFILYQSPPKRDLKVSDPKVRNLSLAELQLAPSSVLLLRFEEESLNGSNVAAPLVASVLSQAVDLPTPPQFNPIVKGAPAVASGSTMKKKGKGMPKWLLPGRK